VQTVHSLRRFNCWTVESSVSSVKARDGGIRIRRASIVSVGQCSDANSRRTVRVLSRLALTILLLMALPRAYSQTYDPTEILTRVRTRLLADVEHLDRFTCIRTLSREEHGANHPKRRTCDETLRERERRSNELPLTSRDRLRLDISIAGGKEIYSWAGASRFEGGIDSVIHSGSFHSGDFGPIMRGIFQLAKISYLGEKSKNGRRLLEYRYSISKTASDYLIRTESSEVITAYEGELLIDPQILDLVQLETRTVDLPEETGFCRVINHIDYVRTQIGTAQILLPGETLFRAISRYGETVNRSSYTSCREYVGESVLRFDVPETETQQETAVSAVSLKFPSSLQFRCHLASPLDFETAAAGDAIEAILDSPITGKDGAVIVPVGTHLHGRLSRVSEEKSPQQFEIGVLFEWIDVQGRQVPFSFKRFFYYPKKPSRVEVLDAEWRSS
jgi:hypothetical protein